MDSQRSRWLRRAIPTGILFYVVLLALVLRSRYAVPFRVSLFCVGLPMLILCCLTAPRRFPAGRS